MTVKPDLLDWVKSSPKRAAVLRAMEHDHMTSIDIFENVQEFHTTITLEEVEAILKEFIEKGLVKP